MRLLGPLLRNVAVALALVALLDWWFGTSSLPLNPEQVEVLLRAFAFGWIAEVVLIGLALVALTRPLRRALAVTASSTEAEAIALATAAHRVPAGGALAASLAGSLVAVACLVAVSQAGLPTDLAMAQAGVGVAAAILGGMAVYALCASTVGAALERLGPRAEGRLQGTVRGKILVVSFGLNTVALLLFAATGYVTLPRRHRSGVRGGGAAGAAERAAAPGRARSRRAGGAGLVDHGRARGPGERGRRHRGAQRHRRRALRARRHRAWHGPAPGRLAGGVASARRRPGGELALGGAAA